MGLYVPSSTTGTQTVKAQAVGTACGNGYAGSTTVRIASAGATVSGTITMLDATTCPPMSGTGPARAAEPTVVPRRRPCGRDTSRLCLLHRVRPGQPRDLQRVVGVLRRDRSVAFSPDGKTFVSAEGSAGNNVKVWSFDGHTLTPKTVLASDGWWSLTFSADGSLLAVAVNGGVDLWNTSNWTLKTTLLGSSNFFVGVAFTPDQTHIIALDQDSGATFGTLYVFDLNAATSQIPIKTLTLTDGPEDLAVASKAVNGQVGVAVSYGDGFADVFSYANGAFSTPVNVVVDSAGFDRVAAGVLTRRDLAGHRRR